MRTIEDALRQGARALAEKHIDTAGLDAMLLLGKATGQTRLELMLNETDTLTESEEDLFQTLLTRRLQHEPMAYILEEKEFWGLSFYVCPGVLIPRPDTETLIATVLTFIQDKNLPLKFADIGIGSGCIALSLLSELPEATAVGVDISKKALEVSQKNADALDLADRLSLIQGEGAAALPEPVSMIVSNPPYVAETERETLQVDVKDYEPQEALFAGHEGLDVYRSLIPQAYDKLTPNGLLVLEIGYTQREAVTELLKEEQWQETTCYQDLAGRDRVLVALRR